MINLNEFTCYTGGAQGADFIWESECQKHKIKVIAYSFEGHKTKSKNKQILTENELNEGFQHIEITNQKLNRNLTTITPYVKNLISRDWFQVKNSDTIFAIGYKATKNSVAGGTGWAVSCAIDNNKKVYLFEQTENKWYKYDYQSDEFKPYNNIPKLTKNFAGIGTREINDNGVRAIIELFKRSITK